MVFLGSVCGGRVDLRGDLDLLAVTIFRISKVRELLSEVGEVTTLLVFFAFLLRWRQTALVLLLRGLRLLLRLHFFDDLIERAIIE